MFNSDIPISTHSISDFFLLLEIITMWQIDGAAYKLKPRSFHKSTHLQVHIADFYPQCELCLTIRNIFFTRHVFFWLLFMAFLYDITTEHHYLTYIIVRVVNNGLGFILLLFLFIYFWVYFSLFGYRQKRQSIMLHVT